MRSVKPGGSVVYSTCTLSPVQNDGVVYDAIKNVWNEDGIESVSYTHLTLPTNREV